MKRQLLEWLRCPDCGSGDLALAVTEEVVGEVKEGRLACGCGQAVRITDYVPRFVDGDSYVDNFSF